MKNNKYYTPTIEEFHVGFEYEHLQDEELCGQITRGIDYCKYTLDAEDELEVIVANLKDDRLRVKYLDKEDIENLGFKQIDKVNKSRYLKGDISIWLGDYNKGMLSKIEVRDRDRAVGVTKLFIGNIKNKSELIKILKQLNIQ